MCWPTLRKAAKLQRVRSDISYIEESLKNGRVPKGFELRWKPQGLDGAVEERALTVLKDTSLRLMEVCCEGMGRKEARLSQEMRMEMQASERHDIKERVERMIAETRRKTKRKGCKT